MKFFPACKSERRALLPTLMLMHCCIENREPLFKDEYEDPDFVNYCFVESDGDEDDE
jgi:hypothetical protein